MTGRHRPTGALPQIDSRDAPALALLGHDLRAALSEVIGGLRLIDSADLSAATRAQIARSRASSEALALLLEEALGLLLGTDADAEGPSIRTARLIDGIRLRWQGRAEAAGARFALRAGADLPDFLFLDPALIERILSNLLGNAFKHGGGGVECGIGLDGPDLLRIIVTDEGPGFANGILQHLFDGARRPEAASKPGSGLGLRIVREMVEGVGGKISAANRSVQGAEIVVRLPLQKPQPGGKAAADLTAFVDLGKLRVLVADDNETSRRVLAQMLSQLGAEVVTVGDGVSAIGKIERESFDALLIDIEMPRFSGLEVIRYLRNAPGQMAKMPILAVTAYALRANREAILAAGAMDVLSKPDLTTHGLGQALMAATKGLPADPPAAPPADAATTSSQQFERLLRMAGPDNAQELLRRLLDDLRTSERNLLGSARGQNWTGLRATSHVLIGLAGTAGADRLLHLSRQLNDLAHQSEPDQGTFLTVLPQTLEALDVLIHFVEGRAATIAGAP